jgi:hypothetical protein
MMNIACDIHIHTTFSDGHNTPTEVVAMAKAAGLGLMAVTDHDTVAGVEEGVASAAEAGITCLAGIEFSTFLKEEVHVLGYNVPYQDMQFLDEVAKLQNLRRKRVLRVVEKLRHHGVKIEVGDQLDSPSAGRSHVAELLVKQGFVRSKAEAFDKYIGKGAPCYVEGMRVSPADAVSLVARSGGVPVLAHPYRMLQARALPAIVEDLVKSGLKGIEVYYPNYGQDVRANLKAIAKRFGLIVTGGSDYHCAQYGTSIGGSGAFLDDRAQKLLLK